MTAAGSAAGAPRGVAVTGFGAVTPVGNDRESTWRALLAGRSGVGPITAFDPAGAPVRIAAEVRDFDPAAVLTGKRLRRSARFTRFAVAAAREAVADAGLRIGTAATAGEPAPARAAGDAGPAPASTRPDPDAVPADRVGVIVNAAVAGFDTIEGATRQLLAGDERHISPYFVASSLTNMPACEVAIDLGVHGPVTASALACASGLYAFVEARRLIAAGEADVVICGGTDAAITPVMFAGLGRMGALSTRNDDPAAASRPFDADRDGFVFGEGAVLAVLESAEHAARRGAAPYATLAGGALTADAFHVSAPDPTAAQATAAITGALRNADVKPDEVDYVCAHGTGTRANDRTETAALHAAFGSAADRLAISSPKSMVGHMIGAAGALGAMVCALAVRDGRVPPTINLDTPDPECDLDYVPHAARTLPVSAAIADAFGFGGQNCVAVFTRPD
ncbi:beta-ketoacyl synthase N-terminal-like domain-containing protein [Actinocatenispora sera]|uniref:3-oxoacyl-[acyl-carrier-protein] synthase 2 n=1 Tax=Actinocatenispora sera TaxID=390989 RepID=A0A810LAY8_9ACTN|nr:beta-ketoacyl synthase N-terminal-like domain-containing protein [Actinocatenispora sera]BCJ31188.1 3-oxoacyl-[acyl-carrier-protein] synthase 2 [Actinocatenispora sera]